MRVREEGGGYHLSCKLSKLLIPTVKRDIPPRVYVVMNDPGHGLLQILSFSTVFANGHYEYASAVSSAFVGLATI